jgi:hypothetical protein
VTVTRRVNIPHAFEFFDLILRHFLPRKFNKEDGALGVCQKLTKVIISILKSIDYSDRPIRVITFGLEQVTSKEYINFLCNVSRYFDPEGDMLRGFESAHFLLRGLAIKFKGIITPHINQKIQIYSLFFICNYYSNCIRWDDLKSLEIETANPLMLAFLLKFDGYYEVNYLFSLLKEPNNLALGILDKYKGFSIVKKILSIFGKDTRCRALLPGISEEMVDTRDIRIYLRLALYCSQIKKEPIKQNLI